MACLSTHGRRWPVPAALAGMLLSAGIGCSTGLDGAAYDLDGGASSSSSASASSAGGGGASSASSSGGGGTSSSSGSSSSSSAGTGGATCYDGMGAGGSPSCADGDEFDVPGGPGPCWLQLGPTSPPYTVANGALSIQPLGDTGSFDEKLAQFLYRSISGDFLVATYVIAGSAINPAVPPVQNYNMAGLFVRSPVDPASTGMEAWIKYEFGYRDSGLGGLLTPVGTLAATTVASISHHVLPYGAEDTHMGGLAICRFGSNIVLYERLCDVWALQYTLTEGSNNVPTLPTEVQVGVIAGAFELGMPDLRAFFRYVRFAPPPAPSNEPDCFAALEKLAP